MQTKLSTQTIIIAAILSIVLFVVGWYSWGDIFIALLPIGGNVNYFETSFSGQFSNSLLFSITLALLPIATIFIWKFAPIFRTHRKILTLCIIVIAMIVSVLLRREMIKYRARHLQPTTILDYADPSDPRPMTIETGIPVSTIHFEIFTFGGLVLGSLISFLSLRQRTE